MNVLAEGTQLETVLNSYRGAAEHTLVYYTAGWCGPCKTITPLLNEYAANPPTGSSVRYLKVDVDLHPDLCEARDVQTIPHLEVYQGTKCVEIFQSPTKSTLPKLVQKYGGL